MAVASTTKLCSQADAIAKAKAEIPEMQTLGQRQREYSTLYQSVFKSSLSASPVVFSKRSQGVQLEREPRPIPLCVVGVLLRIGGRILTYARTDGSPSVFSACVQKSTSWEDKLRALRDAVKPWLLGRAAWTNIVDLIQHKLHLQPSYESSRREYAVRCSGYGWSSCVRSCMVEYKLYDLELPRSLGLLLVAAAPDTTWTDSQDKGRRIQVNPRSLVHSIPTQRRGEASESFETLGAGSALPDGVTLAPRLYADPVPTERSIVNEGKLTEATLEQLLRSYEFQGGLGECVQPVPYTPRTLPTMYPC